MTLWHIPFHLQLACSFVKGNVPQPWDIEIVTFSYLAAACSLSNYSKAKPSG